GPRGPAAIELQAAVAKDLSDVASAVGTLRANETVMLRSEVAGRIASLYFKDGELVAKGQSLLGLDASVQEAELAQAKAELALGQTSFERSKDLAQRQFVSESALDQAAANLRVLEAKFQLSKARLDRTSIRAPFAGQLGLRNVSLGDYVKEGTDLVLLEDIASLKVDLRLPERFLGRLKKGQAIQVLIDAFPGKVFRAQVDAIDVQVDANGRFVLVRGSMANPGGSLRSGMFARASLVLAERKAAVMVPEEAITPIGNSAGEYWDGLIAGRSGAGPITHFDASPNEVRIAAEVKGFDPLLTMDMKMARRMSRFVLFAIAAATEAIEHAGLADIASWEPERRDRVATVINTGGGGIEQVTMGSDAYREKGGRFVSAFAIPALSP
ncbi:MAG: efflux RND transporter periplasmic adaptor subunit, partial [Betaproteobacteria bacterium]|nr:efflux RND transporter periplasmic adaptor subunit [Betaproteobacteria bacterium]